MRLAIEWPNSFRVVIRAAGVGGCLVVFSAGCSDDRGDAAAARSVSPDGALDPLNRWVLVEGGAFVSGSEDWADEFPAGSPYSKEDEDMNRWTVSSFWMQEHEVTNEEYRRCDPDHDFPATSGRHPVVNVTWTEAMAYAVSLRGDLPTEVEWEFAARSTERREYPWGEAMPTCLLSHYRECVPRSTIEIMTRPDDATPEGIYDLAGNVREWVTPVWFDREKHPVNPDALRLKGGSFVHPAFFLRAAAVTNYLATDYAADHIGFRVVWRSDAGSD